MAGKRRIVIPCRFAYLKCWKPEKDYGGQKYSLSAIIPKDDIETVEAIRRVIDYVKEQSVDKWGGQVPSNLRMPLHDGDKEKPHNPVFKNCFYLNAKTRQEPQIVDQNVNPITNEAELYSGCYGKVSLTFYAYNFSGNKGISVWLGNIQKIRDGKRLSRTINASDEFSPIEEDVY